MSHTSSDTESKPAFRGISLRIDGKVLVENLTGMMIQVDPTGNIAVDTYMYNPEWHAEQERRLRESIAKSQ